MTLDLIWNMRGSVYVGEATNEATLARVERLLNKQRKPVTERGPDHLAFEAPLWRDPFGPNWLAMVIFDQGRFWIEPGPDGRRLRYELRSLHAMLFCLLVAIIFCLVGLAGGGVSGGLKFAAFAFGWLYGMNVLLALGRVPSSIRKALRTA